VAFYVVYIAEAHASDMWQMQSNVRDGVIFANPTTNAERERIANSCVRNLHILFPALLDSVQNRVEHLYTGWPDRLYVIGQDGVIRYKSEPGPFGFSPERLAIALEAIGKPNSSPQLQSRSRTHSLKSDGIPE
jgi:hypothetical protein